MVLVAVGKDSSVVLRTQVGLNTLALSRGARVDVLSSLVATDEANRLDARFVDDEINRLSRTMYNVDDARREASLLSKLCKYHASTGVAFRGLDNDSVTGNSGDGDGPEGNHGREVCCSTLVQTSSTTSRVLTEWADGSHNAQWLSVAACLHVLGDLEDFASHLCRDTAGSLSNL